MVPMQRTLALAAIALASCGPKTPAVTVPAPPAKVADTPPPVKAPPALDPAQPALRLPRNFLPKEYTARLAIDPAKAGFDGTIAITGTISERSAAIWLHGRGLDITKAMAHELAAGGPRSGTPEARPNEGAENDRLGDRSSGRGARGPAEVHLAVTKKGEDLLEIRPDTPLDAGEWQLVLDYKGTYDLVNTTGIFKQTVADQPYVYTQLEAIYARRVFPCFDEPDNKVPWQLTLDVPKQLVAVANTPVVSESPVDANTKRVEFGRTKPLPSYLLALGVGPFDIVDAGRTARGTPVRIVTLAKRGAEAAWAAKTTPRILEHLEDWFGTPYPYEKLDMLSIPITVGFGAMENAGLVTFSETLILIDPLKAAKFKQHTWVVVAAHELAHQWFGDLVTMEFWDDIWLNEGFANWMEHKISAAMDPSWHDEQSELGTRNSALGDDALVSARRIRQPIATPDDILNAFDGITYDKGASVLNMFETYLGPEVFQRGVREYIAAHAFGNATSKDFAAAISKASGKDVTAAFASFLEQAGAPEITATLKCESGKVSLELAQQHYVAPGSPKPDATTPWIVPVCLAYDKAGQRAEACSLLGAPTGSIALDTKACPRWVMPNVDGRGYFRNAYTTQQLTALRDEAWPKLSWTERRALYFDVEEAVATGKLPLQLALSLVPKMLAGNDRFTVGPALGLPGGLANLVPDELRAKYEAWLRATFGPGAAKAGFVPKDTDTLDIEANRRELLGVVGWLARDPALVAEAVKLADKWRDLPQATRSVVLEIAVDARPEVFDRILRDVMTETDRQRRDEMLGALAGVRDTKRQLSALALVLEPKLDARETLSMLFGGAYDANRAVAQQFFRDHQDAILARVPHDEVAGTAAGLSGLFTATCRAEQRDAIADYVGKTFAKMPGGARVVTQNIEEMDQCIARRKVLDPEIRAWLGGVKIPKPVPQAKT
jgi:aminopeptidase N